MSTYIREAIKDKKLQTAEEIIKAAMVASRDDANCWLSGNEDDSRVAELGLDGPPDDLQISFFKD
jgi:hypothetical protein